MVGHTMVVRTRHRLHRETCMRPSFLDGAWHDSFGEHKERQKAIVEMKTSHFQASVESGMKSVHLQILEVIRKRIRKSSFGLPKSSFGEHKVDARHSSKADIAHRRRTAWRTKIAQFLTHYLTKGRSYVSTQRSGQLNTFRAFSVYWKVA